jgi:ABC-2 type transport system permease protein/oleandomycin transport system permease protein
LILTQLLGATTAVALATDLAGGMVDRFRSLPITRSATLAGRTIADLARATLVLLVGLGAGVAVGFRFHNGFLPGVAGLGLVLAFSYAMSWEMAWIALKVKDPETAQVAGFLPVVPFVFASSGFVPVLTMPGWLQGFANVQPFSVTISAVRALTQGGPTAHFVWQSAAWIVGIGIVFGALAIAEYRKS